MTQPSPQLPMSSTTRAHKIREKAREDFANSYLTIADDAEIVETSDGAWVQAEVYVHQREVFPDTDTDMDTHQ